MCFLFILFTCTSVALPVLATVLRAIGLFIYLFFTAFCPGGCYYYPHFTDGKTVAQGIQTCPRIQEAESGPAPRPPGQSCPFLATPLCGLGAGLHAPVHPLIFREIAWLGPSPLHPWSQHREDLARLSSCMTWRK